MEAAGRARSRTRYRRTRPREQAASL